MRLLLLVFVSTLLAVWLFSANGEDFLAPEAAFPVAVAVEADTLTITVDIQDGYYLYRDKIRLSSQDLILEKTPWPAAVMKNDPSFGEVAIYPQPLTLTWTIAKRQSAIETADIFFEYQGCSEAGLCYPPQRLTLPVHLPVHLPAKATPALPVNLPLNGTATVSENVPADLPGDLAENPASASASSTAKPIEAESYETPTRNALLDATAQRKSFGLQQDELLAPEVAFVPQLLAEKNGQLAIFWRVQPGYYLYEKSLEIKNNGQNLAMAWDAALEKEDAYFGKVLVYPNDFLGKILDAIEGDTLTVAFQGCSEKFGVCYPTVSQNINIPMPQVAAHRDAVARLAESSLPSNPINDENSGNESNEKNAGERTAVLSETESIRQNLAEKSFFINILIFFGLGLLLAFTPCVFPMIPILSGIIAGQSQLSAWRGFSLSVVYVLGMALTYTALGVAMALLGAEANLQAAMQNPWVLGSFASIFVLLALSMFGLYDLQLPPSWQAALSNASNQQRGGHYVGVAVMGVLSALIVGPCVAAPLAGALLYISQSGDVWLGGSALFAMSLGMGLPLLLIGASAGHWLPKAGAWMDATKAVFGVLLLAVGIWLISRVLPSDINLLLWAALFLGSGVYLGAFAATTSGWQRLRQTLGLASVLFAITLFLGAASGGKSLWPPLAHWQGQSPVSAQALIFEKVNDSNSLTAALAAAGGQKVMLDFTADWCIACQELEEITFKDQRVQQALADYRLLQVDLSQQTPENLALLKTFGLFGPPALLFFNDQGQELRGKRIIGFVPPEKFLGNLP